METVWLVAFSRSRSCSCSRFGLYPAIFIVVGSRAYWCLYFTLRAGPAGWLSVGLSVFASGLTSGWCGLVWYECRCCIWCFVLRGIYLAWGGFVLASYCRVERGGLGLVFVGVFDRDASSRGLRGVADRPVWSGVRERE